MNVLYYILFVVLTIYIISFKTIEGFNDDFYNYKTLPNSYIYNSNKSKHNDMFYFYKGKGSYKKEKIKRDIEEDKKISTLNNLLDRLLGKILSDEQDCSGSFGKYSECDKQCGLGGNQTRKYTITQEKGKNGQACPHEDGYEEKIPCFIDECQLGDLCENDRDCDTRNCEKNSKRCGERIECDKDNLNSCDQDQCRQLNEEYGTEEHLYKGKYLYELNSGSCFFKTPAEVEEMTVNLYTYNFENPDIEEVSNEDCAYYQEIRNNECVNKDNIILGSDYNPKCSPGRSPQPNAFNMDHACEICSGENFDPISENCSCKQGYFLNGDVCEIMDSSAIRYVKNYGGNGCVAPREGEVDINHKKNIFRIVNNKESQVCISNYEDSPSSARYCPPGSFFNWEANEGSVANEDSVENGDSVANEDSETGAGTASCLPCPSGFDTESEGDMSVNIINNAYGKYKRGYSYYQLCSEQLSSYELVGDTGCGGKGTMGGGGICSCFPGAELNQSTCVPCGINQFSAGDNNQCQNCPAGTFAPAGSGECVDCPGETYSLAGENCNQCPVGQQSNVDKDGCYDCPDGTYRSLDEEGCTPCAEGSTSEAGGICRPCDAGTYRNTQSTTDGNELCKNCPEGTYQDETGQTYCKVKEECWSEGKYYTSLGSRTADSQCAAVELEGNKWCSRGSGDNPPRGDSIYFNIAIGRDTDYVGSCPSSPTDYLDDDPTSGATDFNCAGRHINTNVSDGNPIPVSADGGSLHKNQMAYGPTIERNSASGDGLTCIYQYGCVESNPVKYCYLKPSEENTPDEVTNIKRWYVQDEDDDEDTAFVHDSRVTEDNVSNLR